METGEKLMKKRNAFVLTLIALFFSSPLLAQDEREWYPTTTTEILDQTDDQVSLQNGNLPNAFIYGAWSLFDHRDNTKMTLVFDPNGKVLITGTKMMRCPGGWCEDIVIDTKFAHWFIFSRSIKQYWTCFVYTHPDAPATVHDNFYCWVVEFKRREEERGADGTPIGIYAYLVMQDPMNEWVGWYTNPIPAPANRHYAQAGLDDFGTLPELPKAIQDTVCYGNVCRIGR